MTSEERAAIEKRIGRPLRAEEIGRGSINRPAPAMTWEQEKAARRAAIAAANQQEQPHQPRWIESTLQHDGTKPKRENRKQAFKRLHESQEERAADSEAAAERAAKLANDPVYIRMNRLAEQTVERLRWDDSYPESAWERALQMQQAAKAEDRTAFQTLNKAHVEYLESVTNEKQSAIDGEIARLEQVKKTLADDRYEEPLPAPDKSTYGHIRRASGMMQFVNNADGHIVEYDPRVPGAREFAEQKLAKHQIETRDRYGESIPVSSLSESPRSA